MISDDKIVILNKDTVIACAGYVSSINIVTNFFKNPDWEDKLAKDDIPEIKKEVEGLLLHRGVMYMFDEYVIPTRLHHPFYALGSGWKFAMAAMHTGLAPVDAVKFAGEFDIYTNQKVRYLNVEDFIRNSKTQTRKGTSRRSGGKAEQEGTTVVDTAEEDGTERA